MYSERNGWVSLEQPNQVPPEKPAEIERHLQQLHESGEFLARGVFFDVYKIDPEKSDEETSTDETQRFVFKDFRAGDVLMSTKEQIALLQHQYYEQANLRAKLGEQFFPESYWIRSDEFTDDDADGFLYPHSANTMTEALKIQLDRQLADRYGGDDKAKGAYKKMMGKLGHMLISEHTERPFIGGMIQEHVKGITFQEAISKVDLDDPRMPELKKNTQALITALRIYHSDNPYNAFTWHGLNSDNVMVETDEQGKITGRVVVIDANFTERPLGVWKDKVVQRMEKDIFTPLEDALDLPSRG